MKRLIAVALVVISLGCNSKSASSKVSPQDLSQTLKIAPKDLIEVARKVIASPPYSLSFEEESRGKLVTGYQNFQGEFHVVRYWPQRTRYIVKISPDFDEPTTRSLLEVSEETQQQVAGAMEDGKVKW